MCVGGLVYDLRLSRLHDSDLGEGIVHHVHRVCDYGLGFVSILCV